MGTTADWDETVQDVDDWISVVGFFGSGTERQRAVAFSEWFHPLISSFERLDST